MSTHRERMARLTPAVPVRMWSAVQGVPWGRSWQINTGTISRTRSKARAAYLAQWDEDYHARALKRVRFARVIVSMESTQ